MKSRKKEKLAKLELALRKNLTSLDAKLTEVFTTNLHEAINLVNNPSGLNENNNSRLLLLLSALSHHLEDFIKFAEKAN